MKLIMAPNRTRPIADKVKVFLAGSIEMGAAENWQTKLINELSDMDIVLYNPRRDDWDSFWVQSINNPQFKEQVTWELDSIEAADIVVFYFDPNTKSPITLMELGFVRHLGARVIVCCPDGFWRKGNVEIMCHRMGAQLHDNFTDFVKEVRAQASYKTMIDGLRKL